MLVELPVHLRSNVTELLLEPRHLVGFRVPHVALISGGLELSRGGPQLGLKLLDVASASSDGRSKGVLQLTERLIRRRKPRGSIRQLCVALGDQRLESRHAAGVLRDEGVELRFPLCQPLDGGGGGLELLLYAGERTLLFR